MFIFPPQRGFAVFTVDVCDRVQPSKKDPLLRWTTAHVDHRIEEVGSSLTSLKRLGDQLIVVGQVGSAVDTAVGSVTVWQISLERFGFCHLHHLGWALLAQLRAGTGRPAALLGPLTRETAEDARKGRRRSEGVWHCPHSWDERKASQPVNQP